MPQPQEGSVIAKKVTQRKPTSDKRKRQNREAQRTFRERQKKELQALQRAVAKASSEAENASKVKSAPQLQLLQNENLVVDTAASSIPDALQPLACQEGSASLPAPSPPSSSGRRQPEQPFEGRGTTTHTVFMPGHTNVDFQSPSDGPVDDTGQWIASFGNNLDVSTPLDYAAGFPTLSSSIDYNNRSDIWSFLGAQTSVFPSIPPFSTSTPDIFSSVEGTTTATSAATQLGKRQGSLNGPHDSILRSMASRYAATSEPQSPTSEFAENISFDAVRHRRVSGDHTGALDTLQLLHIHRNEENKALLKRALAQDHSLGEIFLAGLRVLGGPPSSPRRTQFNVTSALPDVQANYLTLRHMNIFQAFFANAVALHFPVEKLIGSNSLSPFYRPEAKTTEALQSIMDIIPDTLPRDLRPTFPQVAHEHSPFLDLLPFPMLRARAIIFATCTPPVIDLVELKNDIIDGGLVCWNASQKASGQPWDMRSWEAAPWFLDKWKILVGGVDDEMWGQTTWWKQL